MRDCELLAECFGSERERAEARFLGVSVAELIAAMEHEDDPPLWLPPDNSK